MRCSVHLFPLCLQWVDKDNFIFSRSVQNCEHGLLHSSCLPVCLPVCLSILIRSNEMQQYAGVYLLQNYSTCFGCLSHPSSGVHQTVTAASGTGHSVRATTFRQRGLIKLWHYDLYQKLQLQFDVLLLMGAIETRNMQSNFAVKNTWILLHLVGSY